MFIRWFISSRGCVADRILSAGLSVAALRALVLIRTALKIQKSIFIRMLWSGYYRKLNRLQYFCTSSALICATLMLEAKAMKGENRKNIYIKRQIGLVKSMSKFITFPRKTSFCAKHEYELKNNWATIKLQEKQPKSDGFIQMCGSAAVISSGCCQLAVRG